MNDEGPLQVTKIFSIRQISRETSAQISYTFRLHLLSCSKMFCVSGGVRHVGSKLLESYFSGQKPFFCPTNDLKTTTT